MIAKKRLEKIALSGNIPHLLLFSGDKEEITLQAMAFVQKVLGKEKNHPDLHELFPEGKSSMHSLSSIKMMLSSSALYPVKGSHQFFILHEAERLLPSSSHALLKTLEEPSSPTVFILLTTKPKRILNTIASRAQKVIFPSKESDELILYKKPFVEWLSKGVTLEEISTFAKNYESKRKEKEKKLIADLPAECGPVEKELLMKEIEGALSLEAKEKFTQILETILLWYRDLWTLKEGLNLPLYFREKRAELEKRVMSSQPLEHVEGILRFAQMAFDRTISFENCLETIFLRLNLV